MLSYRSCTLCPRRCGVDREAGELGFCRMPGQLRAARAMLHYGEEPPICANYGTGAVFFSGCTLRCRYCQNGVISTGGAGEALTPEALRETFLRLIDEGAQSIDLVTPTHFLPSILPALTPRLPVPVIYNCGGYESVETLRELEGLIDIYLPDYKYADPELAARLSGARDYPAVAAAAPTTPSSGKGPRPKISTGSNMTLSTRPAEVTTNGSLEFPRPVQIPVKIWFRVPNRIPAVPVISR